MMRSPITVVGNPPRPRGSVASSSTLQKMVHNSITDQKREDTDLPEAEPSSKKDDVQRATPHCPDAGPQKHHMKVHNSSTEREREEMDLSEAKPTSKQDDLQPAALRGSEGSASKPHPHETINLPHPSSSKPQPQQVHEAAMKDAAATAADVAQHSEAAVSALGAQFSTLQESLDEGARKADQALNEALLGAQLTPSQEALDEQSRKADQELKEAFEHANKQSIDAANKKGMVLVPSKCKKCPIPGCLYDKHVLDYRTGERADYCCATCKQSQGKEHSKMCHKVAHMHSEACFDKPGPLCFDFDNVQPPRMSQETPETTTEAAPSKKCSLCINVVKVQKKEIPVPEGEMPDAIQTILTGSSQKHLTMPSVELMKGAPAKVTVLGQHRDVEFVDSASKTLRGAGPMG